jgi:hypothetical protein
MKIKRIFAALFAIGGSTSKRRAMGLGQMQLVAPQRYGTPVRGWRKVQSQTRHREIQRRRRRNAA